MSDASSVVGCGYAPVAARAEGRHAMATFTSTIFLVALLAALGVLVLLVDASWRNSKTTGTGERSRERRTGAAVVGADQRGHSHAL